MREGWSEGRREALEGMREGWKGRKECEGGMNYVCGGGGSMTYHYRYGE